ncbi:MAG: TerB family tellurite resistance protein [Polyangiaceae bacterium]
MALYLFLGLFLAVLPITILYVSARGLRALVRRARLETVELSVEPRALEPGDVVRVAARVVPKRPVPLEVSAALECTLFDHRSRRLFSRAIALRGSSGELARGELEVPPHALATGMIGQELSNLFSEQARRLLAFWTVVFEVREASATNPGRGPVLLRRAVPVEVTGGAKLSTDGRFVHKLVANTFAALKDDLVFNWLVQMASIDGEISESEREFLRELLRSAHGVTDVAAADARIAAEQHKRIELDPELMRRHLPIDQRQELYQLLFAVAWRDGVMHPREHERLMETLRAFGLDNHHIREIELEVLRGVAEKSME